MVVITDCCGDRRGVSGSVGNCRGVSGFAGNCRGVLGIVGECSGAMGRWLRGRSKTCPPIQGAFFSFLKLNLLLYFYFMFKKSELFKREPKSIFL